jgi:hypothetical protein
MTQHLCIDLTRCCTGRDQFVLPATFTLPVFVKSTKVSASTNLRSRRYSSEITRTVKPLLHFLTCYYSDVFEIID